MTRWSGFLLPTGNMFTFTCILEKNTMSNKNLPPVNVPKDELKAIIAYDKERFSKNLTPLRAVRLKCLDCCGDSSKEVEACSAISCPLWWYRKSPSSLDATAIKIPHSSSGHQSDVQGMLRGRSQGLRHGRIQLVPPAPIQEAEGSQTPCSQRGRTCTAV